MIQTPETFDSLLSHVDSLAAKLGIAAQHLMEIYVRQAYVTAVLDFWLLTILSLVLWFGAKRLIVFIINKLRDCDRYCDSAWIFGLIVTSLVTGVVAIFALCSLFESVSILMNPQYWAIQKLLSDLGHLL